MRRERMARRVWEMIGPVQAGPATVLCLEASDRELEQLRSAFSDLTDLEVRFLPGGLEDHIEDLGSASILSVFIHSSVDATALERLPSLKLVATRSTGYDHIDLEACSARAVAVANVPTYGENTVAEHTFAMILALSRRLLAAERKGRRGDFDLDGLQGFDLKDRTLGVVGAGRIGLHVIRIARAFGMEVVAHDLYREELLAEVLGFRYAELPELLAQSDVVTLHAPALPETHHLIDRDALATMRDGALLINTARGSLIDTAALVEALDSGHLGGAGLDVFEGEQAIREDHELLGSSSDDAIRAAFGRRLLADREDVILTPHNAFNSFEAVQRIADATAANIRSWLAGEPRNLVCDPSRPD
jgi:D-lactate dehydrogenase